MARLRNWWRGLFTLTPRIPLDQIHGTWTQLQADEQNRWGQHGN